jgi:lipopolysaccharide transport system permease protein
VAISNLVSFGIQLALFLVILFLFWVNGMQMQFTAWFWCTPLFLLMTAAFALGCGLIVSALTTRYRDLANLLTFGVQLFMFATPVIYPASVVSPDKRWVLYLNPLTPIIEGFRKGALGTGTVEVMQVVISAGAIAALLLIGLMLFTHIEKTFMDTV